MTKLTPLAHALLAPLLLTLAACQGDADKAKTEGSAKPAETTKAASDPAARTPATGAPATGAPAASGDCPNGEACISKCKSECEGKHGALMDVAKMQECTKGGGGPECVSKATNQTTRKCFFECRGLPAPN